MASIKVCIRCRPFTIDDDLGVNMNQAGPNNGEVELINSKYTTNRFAFSYSWWSAYGFKHHAKKNIEVAEDMKLINQQMVYDDVGDELMKELLTGSAVVMFAYGLSGSGKTFTVFGPDAADIPEAWFKWDTPHDMWGLFPRVAYNIFQAKEETWKIKMKYFQNVVDTVRDLMSATAKESHYKSGMRKDADGFTDIDWCTSQVIKSWDDLRATFLTANARKAISPTQFNHQSTRGHCIMTIEVEKPNDDNSDMKDRGRLYVCDLAGTEPAGDIYYAQYETKTFVDDDGQKSIEKVLIGPHKDQRKTKELQSQGMKINLSLTEMAQFFMKMAEAVKKKKLKPGQTIPGCNSYFLCKYLKDTLVSAKTYLFCAIRPEVTYHNYTYATLGFAKNASVVKLAPKKAVSAASPAERKLLQELDQLKTLMAQLTAENTKLSTGGSGGDDTLVKQLQEQLAAKQTSMAKAMQDGEDTSSGGGGDNSAEMTRQRDEYALRGISLTYFCGPEGEEPTSQPYLSNLDEDPFRSNRFMYILKEGKVTFGPKGDIRPMSLNVMPDHCSIETTDTTITLVGGKGETFVNGAVVAASQRVVLSQFDRVAMGGELLLLRWAGHEPEGKELPSAEEAVDEYYEAKSSTGSGESDAAKAAFDDEVKKFEEERLKWKEQMEAGGGPAVEEINSMEQKRAMLLLEKEISDLLPKAKEAKKIVQLLDRDLLTFDVSFQRGGLGHGGMGTPTVKVRVHNTKSGEDIFLDPFEFMKGYSVLKDELARLTNAIENDREYVVEDHHDPVVLLFDNTFYLGAAVIFPEFMTFFFPTDEDENEHLQTITSAGQGAHNVGKLEIRWTPLADPEDDGNGELPDVMDESELLGKPWTYRVAIKGATALPILADIAYCQYSFFGGEMCTSETVESEEGTHNPEFDYEFVHHVDSVTQEFVDWLKEPLEVRVFVSPAVKAPNSKVSSANENIRAFITGGFAGPGAAAGGAGAGAELQSRVSALEAENAALKQALKAQTGKLKKDVSRLKMEKKMLIAAQSIRAKESGGDTAGGAGAGGDAKSGACLLM